MAPFHVLLAPGGATPQCLPAAQAQPAGHLQTILAHTHGAHRMYCSRLLLAIFQRSSVVPMAPTRDFAHAWHSDADALGIFSRSSDIPIAPIKVFGWDV